MIGVLCSDGKRHDYASALQTGHAPAGGRTLPLLFFSATDHDSKSGLVDGLAAGAPAKVVRAELPRVILNLSVQTNSSGRRALKALRLNPNVHLINPANRFNQWTVQQMLASSLNLANNQLPMQVSDQRELYAQVIRAQGLLFTPIQSTSPWRLHYLPDSRKAALLGAPGQSEWLDQMLLRISFHQRWLSSEVPELLCTGKRPLVARIYLQRGMGGLWTVLGKSQFNGQPSAGDLAGPVSTLALQAIHTLSTYLPTLGLAFVDFVFSIQGEPFLLHAGGWDYRLLLASELHQPLLDNLFNYAYWLLSHQEVAPDVD